MDAVSSAYEGLSLTAEQWKAVGFLAEFTRRMVIIAFSEPKTPASASNLAKEVYRVTDHTLAGCLKKGTGPSCKPGCHWCCYLQAKVTPLEVWCIVDFSRSNLGARELAEFQRRLAVTDETTRGLDGCQRVRAKMICPLLADERCLVYPVRPIACRFYHSLDVSACQASLDDQDRRVTIRNDITGLGVGISAGLTEGLRTVGLQTRLVELIAGLRIAMDEPDSVTQWLGGKPTFLEAEIANAKRIQSVHRTLVEELAEPWNKLSVPGLGDEGRQVKTL